MTAQCNCIQVFLRQQGIIQPTMIHAAQEHQGLLFACFFVTYLIASLCWSVHESLDHSHARSLRRILHTLDLSHGHNQQHPQHADLAVAQPQTQAARVKALAASDSKVAICTSIKWEQPSDLAEWVQYYQCASFVCT